MYKIRFIGGSKCGEAEIFKRPRPNLQVVEKPSVEIDWSPDPTAAIEPMSLKIEQYELQKTIVHEFRWRDPSIVYLYVKRDIKWGFG